jgi:hypothetical protein
LCMEYAMLAEIFMLRAETAVREAAKDAARFVPITLPTTRLQRRRYRLKPAWLLRCATGDA